MLWRLHCCSIGAKVPNSGRLLSSLGLVTSFFLSGTVIWCGTCGASSDNGSRSTSLAKPCPGRRKKGACQTKTQVGRNGLLQQLRRLVSGVPPPVQIDPNDLAPAALAKRYRGNGGIRIAAVEGALNPVMRAMLLRVRKRIAERCQTESLAMRPPKRRISAKISPGSCGRLLPNVVLMG